MYGQSFARIHVNFIGLIVNLASVIRIEYDIMLDMSQQVNFRNNFLIYFMSRVFSIFKT